ncbi:MAG: transcriptional regulator, partial [Candidatus Lokiarchaeota archaeon]
EEEGYVHVEKKFQGKRPQTILSLTDEGRKAFDEYRRNLNKLLGDIK